MIFVESIGFYSRRLNQKGALAARKNATEAIQYPEWRRHSSADPEDSPVVYVAEHTNRSKITVAVRLSCSNSSVSSLEVRVPKHVVSRRVAFAAGSTRLITFTLISPPTVLGRVGIWDVQWNWQYRSRRAEKWRKFATTRHRFYVVLGTPTAPWSQHRPLSLNNHLPWTDVLSYACRWAEGAKSVETAAAFVTKRVNDLGSKIVTYDCPGGGSSHYSADNLDLSAFLDRLGGGVGNGVYVNCSDCASIVSTFANILGCNLWQSTMGYGFALNKALAIGSNRWRSPCGWTSFNYHEVAWAGGCTVDDGVCDACLHLNGHNVPTEPPYKPLLPINMRFGIIGDLLYRDRLASPAGRPSCNPRPASRRRRKVE
jgi:hypothetical protein